MQTISTPDIPAFLAADATESDLFLGDVGVLRRYPLEALTVQGMTARAEFVDEDNNTGFDSFTLAPNNRLFAVGYDGGGDEVCCFSADTLELKYTFGRGRFEDGILSLAICGQELFAPDRDADCIQVFSLEGTHRRDMRGAFRRPETLLHFNGRLYLIEESDVDYDDLGLTEEQEEEYKEVGCRIFVLTPEGETLQIYKLADKDQLVRNIAILDGRLVVFTCTDHAGYGPAKDVQVFALKGA
jgi:hypothetical protein